MFRCPRCDASFPRVLGKKRYLIIAETELTRQRKEAEDMEKDNKEIRSEIEGLKREQQTREESLRKQLRGDKLDSLESELAQLERHVKYLRTERDRLKKDAGLG